MADEAFRGTRLIFPAALSRLETILPRLIPLWFGWSRVGWGELAVFLLMLRPSSLGKKLGNDIVITRGHTMLTKDLTARWARHSVRFGLSVGDDEFVAGS